MSRLVVACESLHKEIAAAGSGHSLLAVLRTAHGPGRRMDCLTNGHRGLGRCGIAFRNNARVSDRHKPFATSRFLRELDEHFNRGEKTISLIFAAWGYAGPDDARSAKEFGYQVLSIEEFADKLPAMLT